MAASHGAILTWLARSSRRAFSSRDDFGRVGAGVSPFAWPPEQIFEQV